MKTDYRIMRLISLAPALLTICPMPARAGEAAAAAHDSVALLDRVVVTGTRTLQRVSDVPVRTEVLTRQELAPMQPRTLADAMEFTTGVRVENDCQNCNFSQIRLLGLEGAYSQILIDGQPLISSLAAVYAIEQIPASLIERIEVVKGGGSALYGPGSIGGVINLIPRRPTATGFSVRLVATEMTGTHVSSKSPDFGFETGFQADVVSPRRHTAVTVYAQGDRELPVDLTGDGFTEVGLKELTTGGVRFVHEFSQTEGELAVELSRTVENRRGGNALDQLEHEADIAESIQSRRDVASVAWSQTLSSALDYRFAASLVEAERDSYYGAGRDPLAYGHTENPLLVFDAQLNHRFGTHVISWGGQATTEELEDVQPAYSRQTHATYRNTGLFLQDEWRFASQWELLAGARVDDNNQIASRIFSPRVALKWTPTDELVWRAGFATGFRAPQVFDEDLHITQVGGAGQIVKNDPGLAEESARSLTLGGEWSRTAGGLRWNLGCNLFDTRVNDSFVLEEDASQSTADESVLVRRNGSGSHIYGAEFNVGITRGRALAMQFGYVEQRSRYDTAIAPLEGTSTRRIQRTPDRYGTATLDAALPLAGLRLFVGARFTGSMEVPHAAPDPTAIPDGYPYAYIASNRIEKSPTTLTWDASLSREFELGALAGGRHVDLTMRIGVKNLTDDRQKDLDQGEFRDSGYLYGPRFPRSFYVSTEWTF